MSYCNDMHYIMQSGHGETTVSAICVIRYCFTKNAVAPKSNKGVMSVWAACVWTIA